MNRIFLVCLLSAFSQFLIAQSDTLAWFTNFEEAKTAAIENEENMLMVFAGSDWCKPCIQFKKDVLHSADFQAKMKDEVVILYLDFPARRKNKLSKEQTAHNEALAEKYNKSGAFPNVILLNENDAILGNPSFNGQTAADFANELQPLLNVQK